MTISPRGDGPRGERKIQYSNNIRIVQTESIHYIHYIYYSDIRIRIWKIFSNQIIFVLIFESFSKTA